MRPFLFLVIFFSMIATAAGHVTVIEDEKNELITYRMTVSTASEPDPAFRYRLLKHEDVRKDGNAAPFYYRAQMDLDQTAKSVREKYGEEYDTWYGHEVPLADLPKDKVRKALEPYHGSIMTSLREATSRRYCDWGWELEHFMGVETIAFLLPEIQRARDLSRMLALQTRFALAEGRYEDAIEFIQMNYQLGQDVVTEPLLVSGLVGIAITGITNAGILELMAEPDAPNLYWALAELPDPMIHLRPAVRFELGIGPRVFPILQDAESKNLTTDQWAVKIGETFATLFGEVNALAHGETDRVGIDEGPLKHFSPQVIGRLQGLGLSMLTYTTAKKALIECGMTPDQVEAMPVGQVIAIQASRAYQHTAQEYEKNWYMPFDAARQRQSLIQKELQKEGYLGPKPFKEIIPVATMLLPAIQACRTAQERIRRDVAAMRVLEALRMHASSTGKLPTSLADVTMVPVPLNPATNKAFDYKLDGETGVMDLPSSEGFPGFHRRFEITLRK
ncbi:MAG: hypothetical protein JW829_09440 [Pirellulales bacterium]|nr:hypothetical protein [Pirellulales bacterium]